MQRIFLLFFLVSLFSYAGRAQGLQQWYVCLPCGACDSLTYKVPGVCPYCGMTLVKKEAAVAANRPLNVAIFVFDGMELLDFAGPGEVFGGEAGFRVYTVGVGVDAVMSQGFVKVAPAYSMFNCPKPDILVVPGGDVGAVMSDVRVTGWVKRLAGDSVRIMSVCTGAGILSAAGLLDGKTVTTFHNYIDPLQQITPKAKVLRGKRFVDNGLIITTAGISAGIDGALHLLARLKGEAAARQAAMRMEYDKWVPGEGLVL